MLCSNGEAMTNDATTPKKTSPRRSWWRSRWLMPVRIYLVLLVMLAVFQRSLIYHPQQIDDVLPIDAGFAASQVHEVTVTADDGTTLNGWFHPAGGRDCTNAAEYGEHLRSGRAVAVVFCGNAGHRGHREDVLRLFSVLDVDTLIFDYRGYGDNDGSPSETAILADSRAIWRHVTQEQQVAPERMIIFGESLGGGVATQLAAHACRSGEIPRALVLQATFSSLVDAAGFHYPWLPVRWLLLDRFDSEAVIPDVTCPLLHLHGTADEIVPFALGQRLFSQVPLESQTGVPKQFVELPGIGHNNIDRSEVSEYGRALSDFLKQISP
jgi:fermentation-respiration switch protein FrsA (DUF1100 family)